MPLQLAIMAAAGIAGSLLSNRSNARAADRATQAQQEGLRRAEGAYGTARAENAALLNPYITRGNVAQNEFMRSLGLGAASSGAPPSVSPAAPGAASGSPDWGAYLAANPDVMQHAQRAVAGGTYGSLEEAAQAHWGTNGQSEGRVLPTVGSNVEGPVQASPFYGPEQAERPVIERPEVGPRPDVGQRPELARPDFGPRPTANLPGFEEFDYGADDYVESPAFRHQLSRGMESVAQNKAFSGALKSGAATNSALEFATQLAYDDFAAERAFAYGKYKDARDTRRGYAESDLNRAEHAYEFGANRGDQNFNFDANRSDQNYQFGANRSDTNYQFDTNRTDRNFIDERNFASDVFGIDRTYNTGRFDERQRALGGIANQGYGATAALVGGNNTYAQQLAGGYTGQADATANNYLRQGDLTGQLWTNLGQGASYLAGAYGGGGAAGGAAPGTTLPPYMAAASERFMSANPAANPFLSSLYR